MLSGVSLRTKIILTIVLVAVSVVSVGFVQSYYAHREPSRGQFLRKHYKRFDEYRRGLGRAYGASAAFLASDPALAAGLSDGDPAAVRREVTRAARALARTAQPDLIAVVDRDGEPVHASGATRLPRSETVQAELFTSLRQGQEVVGQIAIVDDTVYQVSGAPIRNEQDIVGAVVIGHELVDIMHDYQSQSDANAVKQHRLTLVDGEHNVLTSVFDEADWVALGDATRSSNWRKEPEGDEEVDVIVLPDPRSGNNRVYDFYAAENVAGFRGPGYGELGTLFLMRTRDFKQDEFAERVWSSFWVFLVALLIALGLGLWLAISVTRRIDSYVSATAELAKGGGDLTRRLARGGDDELGRLAENLNAAFGHIHDLAANVQHASFQVGASSAQISAASKQMLDGAREQARKTESSTAAVTELSASIQQVAENANETTRVARSSGEAVQNAIHRMNQIRTTVEEAAARIQELGESGKRIGNIVEVIRQISDQTTLLALNAAIEAAHAGEQGRGFAVVADEVSGLANRVGQSARDIEDLIATIKEQTVDAVRAMEAGTREVEAGTALVTHTLADLTTLVQVVEDTAKAVQEQAVASDEIARNMDVVQRIAQEVLSSSEEAVDQGDHLHRLADTLEQSVKSFRIEGRAGRAPALTAGEHDDDDES